MYERESSGRRTPSQSSESVSVREIVLIGAQAQESNDFGIFRFFSIPYMYIYNVHLIYVLDALFYLYIYKYQISFLS